MPKNVIEYRCLLISPMDVEQEREAISQVVAHWNAQAGPILGCRIELVRWETHGTPDAAIEPQKALNEQFVDGCDLGLAVFWTRLGSKTSTHKSGSLEEIERLLKRDARVLIYFSTSPIPQERLGDDQFAKLQAFKQEMQAKGLVASYNDIPDLREKVQLHLTSALAALVERERAQPAPGDTTSATLTAPRPDVRVQVYAAIVMPGSRPESYLRVVVENHSPVPVFIASLSIITNTGKGLFPQRDAVTHEYQRRRRLEPGESFSFFLDPAELVRSASVEAMEHVLVSDDVGRKYESDTEELRKALRDSLEDKRPGDGGPTEQR